MMDINKLVQEALYEDRASGEMFKLLGTKMRVVVMKSESTGALLEVPYADFDAKFMDTGVHFHNDACCTVHDTHSMPHRGCILR